MPTNSGNGSRNKRTKPAVAIFKSSLVFMANVVVL